MKNILLILAKICFVNTIVLCVTWLLAQGLINIYDYGWHPENWMLVEGKPMWIIAIAGLTFGCLGFLLTFYYFIVEDTAVTQTKEVTPEPTNPDDTTITIRNAPANKKIVIIIQEKNK